MTICGLQKLTLLDFPDKLACTVFTGGCNLRCPFCHNAPLVLEAEQQPQVDPQQLLDFLRKRRGVLDGVCITGGEPLLQPDLAPLIEQIRALGFAVKLDTNGTLPDRLGVLLKQGLVDYIAMDIKNALPRYAETVGLERFDTSCIEKSVKLLQQSGVPYEFRTTVVQQLHTPEDLLQIGRWLQGSPRYFLQNFVASGATIADGLSPWDPQALRDIQVQLQPYFDTVGLRGI